MEDARNEDDFKLGKVKPKKAAAFRELYTTISTREKERKKKSAPFWMPLLLSHLLLVSSVWLFVIDPASGS